MKSFALLLLLTLSSIQSTTAQNVICAVCGGSIPSTLTEPDEIISVDDPLVEDFKDQLMGAGIENAACSLIQSVLEGAPLISQELCDELQASEGFKDRCGCVAPEDSTADEDEETDPMDPMDPMEPEAPPTVNCALCGGEIPSIITKDEEVLSIDDPLVEPFRDNLVSFNLTEAKCVTILMAVETLMVVPEESCPDLQASTALQEKCGCVMPDNTMVVDDGSGDGGGDAVDSETTTEAPTAAMVADSELPGDNDGDDEATTTEAPAAAATNSPVAADSDNSTSASKTWSSSPAVVFVGLAGVILKILV